MLTSTLPHRQQRRLDPDLACRCPATGSGTVRERFEALFSFAAWRGEVESDRI